MVYPTKKELIQQHPLFESLSWWQTGSVAKRASIVEVKKGEVIVEEGQPASAFYLLISGRCEAYRRSAPNRILEQYHNGDSFGEMALLDGGPRSASVVALDDSRMVKITRSSFLDLLKGHPEMSLRIVEAMSRRLRMADGKIGRLALMDVYGGVARPILPLIHIFESTRLRCIPHAVSCTKKKTTTRRS
jgi:CRP-like cAMP-binding protein